ncbi:ATP-dependent RecD-like DNA helicase [Bacteroidota bacterium]
MLKNFIHAALLENLAFQPTRSQEELIPIIGEFLVSEEQDEILLIKGFAGTGKTTIVNSIVKTLLDNKLKSVLLAPTGRAAKVLSSYTNTSAWTIHKKIYRQKAGRDGLGTFVLDQNLHKDTYFIIDEASMIGEAMNDSIFGSGNLLSDLIRFVEAGSRCRLILIGDTAQLPPVHLEISPALDEKVIRSFGYRLKSFTLTDIVRQEKDSGILMNANIIRKNISELKKEIPGLDADSFPDIERVGGQELLECINDSYDRYGEEETIVVTRSNKRANQFNAGIRSQILWREEQISKGDLLMVVKNNYFWKDEDKRLDFIANGDIARIERVLGFEQIYGLRFAEVELLFIDYNHLHVQVKIMLDVLEVEGPSLPLESHRELYSQILEDYPDLNNRKQKAEHFLKDEYYNALQVKFAYAVTCHKAQGGQWSSVFIDQGYFTDEMLSIDYLRWMYTAFTRATKKLYLVNFSDKFFSLR